MKEALSTFLNEHDERHSAGIGFFTGFVVGYTDDEEIASRAARRFYGQSDAGEHLTDTRDELAYASGFFFAGFVVGRWVR